MWRLGAGRDLWVRYRLVGAERNTTHVAGLTLFLASGICIGSFGQVTDHGICAPQITRQGIMVPAADGFDALDLNLDDQGGTDQSFTYQNVAPGRYYVEFEVRVARIGVDFCPNCNVIYQAPGPFSHATIITVP